MSLEKISANGFFHIVALDHRQSIKKIINPKNPEKVSKKTLEQIKLKFSKAFSSQASGILLDPIFGKPAINAIKNKCGLLISLEESGYQETKEGRTTSLIKNFGPENVKKMGGDAAKLLIYFNPKAKTAKQQKKLVEEVAIKCREINLPLVCEFLIYPYKEKDFEKEKGKLIIQSAKEISKLGIDLLKTEFPGKLGEEKVEANCKKLTKASKVPWVLLSRGIDFQKFEEQLEISIKFGCSGFMVGRALWQDYFYAENKGEFLKKICLERLKELKEIASRKFI
ncbi:MAG: tagatose 1,6-diphosphate aldolase [Candidatus Aenigmatarchaeota archaeon]